MKYLLSWTGVFCVVMTSNAISMANWKIVYPTSNPPYSTTAGISPNGTMPIGEDVRVELVRQDTVIADSHYINSGPMATTWSHNFSAPTGGWSPVGLWHVTIRDSAGDPKDVAYIQIVN